MVFGHENYYEFGLFFYFLISFQHSLIGSYGFIQAESEHALAKALTTKFRSVFTVLGARSDLIRKDIQFLPVNIFINEKDSLQFSLILSRILSGEIVKNEETSLMSMLASP